MPFRPLRLILVFALAVLTSLPTGAVAQHLGPSPAELISNQQQIMLYFGEWYDGVVKLMLY